MLLCTLGAQAQERQINVHGNNYHIYLKGFETRKAGTPALIFENGLGVGLGNWDSILEPLAQDAPVFAYDRAGVEKSDVQYKMPTVNQVAENLKSILTALHIRLLTFLLVIPWVVFTSGGLPDSIPGILWGWFLLI